MQIFKRFSGRRLSKQIKMRHIEEIIPCNETFAMSYLKRIDCAERLKAICIGIDDADENMLIDLATVKAKWLSLWLSRG